MIDHFEARAAAYIESAENRARIQKYMDIYLAMMDLLHGCDVSESKAFRRLYNVFYKLRFSGGNGRSSAEIYDGYYGLLEMHKHDAEKPSIELVLSELYALTGKVHLSFGSKLIGTLYPNNAPVWDNNVRILLNIPYAPRVTDDHLALASAAYHELEARYTAFAPEGEALSAEAKGVIGLFDSAFPNGKEIAAWKKIDFLLWRMGSRKSRSTV